MIFRIKMIYIFIIIIHEVQIFGIKRLYKKLLKLFVIKIYFRMCGGMNLKLNFHLFNTKLSGLSISFI